MTTTPALRAFLTVGTIAVESPAPQDALGAGGDQLLDRGDFAVVVAVESRRGLGGKAELLGLGLEALLHLDEEGVGVGLGDEADDSVGTRGVLDQAMETAGSGDKPGYSRNFRPCFIKRSIGGDLASVA